MAFKQREFNLFCLAHQTVQCSIERPHNGQLYFHWIFCRPPEIVNNSAHKLGSITIEVHRNRDVRFVFYKVRPKSNWNSFFVVFFLLFILRCVCLMLSGFAITSTQYGRRWRRMLHSNMMRKCTTQLYRKECVCMYSPSVRFMLTLAPILMRLSILMLLFLLAHTIDSARYFNIVRWSCRSLSLSISALVQLSMVFRLWMAFAEDYRFRTFLLHWILIATLS